MATVTLDWVFQLQLNVVLFGNDVDSVCRVVVDFPII